MSRSLTIALVAAATLAACVADPEDDGVATVSLALEGAGPPGVGWVTDVQRTRIHGDTHHQAFTLTLGASANARIRLHRIVRERAPWLPRSTRGGVMLLHGDFSSFGTNFAPVTVEPTGTPGLAVWLADQGFDVWGFDRRWALTPADGDTSDFGDMGVVQELDDVGRALVAARAVRVATGSGAERLHLLGFSRGGLLAYAAASLDAARPPLLRQIKGLVALDVWGVIPPEDAAGRSAVCDSAFFEQLDLDAGVVDSPNGFFRNVGARSQANPDGASPFPGFTNRELFLFIAGQTYNIFPVTPFYHLAAGEVVDGAVTHLTASPEPAIAAWFATAAPHQSLREAADTDAMWCGDGSAPITLDLARIRVPLLYLGAAGGYGDHGLYTTTQVGSTDVTTRVVRRFPVGGEDQDVGHGDLLFARDAVDLAWRPLAAWLAAR